MAFIRMIEEKLAEGDLKNQYDQVKDPKTGRVDHILKIHSLNPPSLKGHYDFYRTLMFGKSDLSRRQREMIALVVSSLNHCHY